jgi:hypothetical protein
MKVNSDVRAFVIGLLVIGLPALAVGFVLVRPIYNVLSPAEESKDVSVAVAATFEPPATKAKESLRVSGAVLEQGKPLPAGHARVTVRRLNDASQQSVSVAIKDGKFDSGETAAFRDYSRTDRLNIQTDVSKPDKALLISQTLYLNTFPPLRPGTAKATLSLLVIFSIAYFWAFTGVSTPYKNQAAIIVSYLMMNAFLALPFMAFYVLGRYQAVAEVARDVAWSAPVGILPAVPLHDSDGKPATEVEPEWVMNIGGIVIERPQASAIVEQQVVSEAKPGPGTDGAGVALGTTQTDSQTSTVTEGAVKPASTQSGADAAAGSQPQPTTAPVQFAVQGGLVIPVYVLVLSIIGGAINMTRVLPAYQREGQSLDISPHRWLRRVGERLMKHERLSEAFETMFAEGQAPNPKSGEHRGDGSASQRDEDGTETATFTVVATLGRNREAAQQSHVGMSGRQASAAALCADTEKKPVASQTDASSAGGGADASSRTPEGKGHIGPKKVTAAERAAKWRQDLITQHMYLLSSPFLAIAVFYLLDWLDLRKKPLLVLVSFSIGLVSDQILSKILSVVKPVLAPGDAEAPTNGDAKSPQT